MQAYIDQLLKEGAGIQAFSNVPDLKKTVSKNLAKVFTSVPQKSTNPESAENKGGKVPLYLAIDAQQDSSYHDKLIMMNAILVD